MSIAHTILLGIVEGVTEFLPISSTAHLLIVQKLLAINAPESFTIGIQFGSMIAALFVSERLLRHARVWWLVIVGAIPTLVIGYLLYPYLAHMHESLWVIAGALLVGGIIMVIFPIPAESRARATTKLNSMNYANAFMVGLGQVASFIPGISRSASTIYTARALGVSTGDAVQYSFLLAVPVMGAATLYSLYSDMTAGGIGGYEWIPLAIGMIVAGIVAYIAMRWLLWFIQNYSWKYFGWYRIVLAMIIIAMLVR